MLTVIIADSFEDEWKSWYASLPQPDFKLLSVFTEACDLFELFESGVQPDLLVMTDQFDRAPETLICRVKMASPLTECVLLSQQVTVDTLRQAMRAGACEVLEREDRAALQATLADLVHRHPRRYGDAYADIAIDQLLLCVQQQLTALPDTQVVVAYVTNASPTTLLYALKTVEPSLVHYWVGRAENDASVLFCTCESAAASAVNDKMRQALRGYCGGYCVATAAAEVIQLYVSALSGYCTTCLRGEPHLYQGSLQAENQCAPYLFALNQYWNDRDGTQIHDIIEKCLTHMREQERDLSFFLPFYNLLVQLSLNEARVRGIPQTDLPVMGENALALLRQFSDSNEMAIRLHRMVDIVLEIPSQESAYRMDAKQCIVEICNYIRRHPTENFDRQTLAEKYHFSGKYMGNLFKKITGQGLTSYINDVRIEQAKRLLTDTNLTVQSIASLCGYSDYFYFLKTFKRKNGVTPSNYRNSRQETIHKP